MSHRTHIPLAAVGLPGAGALLASLAGWQPADPAVLAAYAGSLALVAVLRPVWSALSFLLVLAGCAVFPLGHVMLAGAVGAAAASLIHRARARDAVIGFSSRMLTTSACYFAFHLTASAPAGLALAVFAYVGVEVAVDWAGGAALDQALEDVLAGPFLYYLLAAAATGMVLTAGWTANAQGWLMMAPLAYLAHFFHGLWKGEAGREGEATPDLLPRQVKAYVAMITATAGVLAAAALPEWASADNVRFAAFLLASVVVSAWKIRLPKLDSAISPGFVLVLVAIAELSIAEVIVIAAVSVLVQSYWGAARRPKPVQVVFNVSCLMISAAASFSLTRVLLPGLASASLALFFVVAWAVLYGGNSFMVSRILSLLQNRPVADVWRECYFWSLPYFLVGAAAAAMISSVSRAEGWQVAMLILPVMGLISMSYRMQVSPVVVRK